MVGADLEAVGRPAPGQGTHCLTEGTSWYTAFSRALKGEIVPLPLEEALHYTDPLEE